jgi:hypothetical protein
MRTALRSPSLSLWLTESDSGFALGKDFSRGKLSFEDEITFID